MFYSGKKKKRHTIKTQIMVNNRGFIIHKTTSKKGKRHDDDMYKENHPVDPKQKVVNVVDLEYRHRKGFPRSNIIHTSKKKEKPRCICAEERYYNKDHSKKRIVIEHAICSLKKYRILADVFRNRLRKYNKVSDIV